MSGWMAAAASAEDLQAALEPFTPVFLLIEPLTGEPVPGIETSHASSGNEVQAARERIWQRIVQTIDLPNTISLPPAAHPYLVELLGPEDPWLAATLDIAHEERLQAQADGLAGEGSAPHRIGGWLQSSLLPAGLARCLAPMMRVNTRAATTARYLRLADRRVLDWLGHVVGEHRLCAPFGRLQRWVYIDACGRLVTLTSRGEDTEALLIGHAEWDQSLQGGIVHGALARSLGELQAMHAESEKPPTPTAPPPTRSELNRQVGATLASAERASWRWPTRMPHRRDLSAWVALTLLHPQATTQARIEAALSAAPEPGETPPTLHTLCAALHAALQTERHP